MNAHSKIEAAPIVRDREYFLRLSRIQYAADHLMKAALILRACGGSKSDEYILAVRQEDFDTALSDMKEAING